MLKIKINDLPKLYDKIASKYPLTLPIKKANEVNYAKYTSGDEVSLSTLKTVKSPKDVFFPQAEDLMKFKVEGQKIEVIDTREVAVPFVVMGVKACDFKAFEVLDRVFLVDPLDTYYQTKRNAGIIVTLACFKPEESCFCSAFKIDPLNPMGDVTTYLTKEYLYWQENTEKGKELTAFVKDLFISADVKEIEDEKKKAQEVFDKLPLKDIDVDALNKDEMLDTFKSDKWKSLSEACLGCGTCTFVCPTCQCFDIRDYKGNDTIKRFRCWDSCMYKDFTKTAGGQPRPTQMQRFRQRFMHKLVYYPENNEGLFSCVGCGRCVKKCPQHLNIVKVIKAFKGDNK